MSRGENWAVLPRTKGALTAIKMSQEWENLKYWRSQWNIQNLKDMNETNRNRTVAAVFCLRCWLGFHKLMLNGDTVKMLPVKMTGTIRITVDTASRGFWESIYTLRASGTIWLYKGFARKSVQKWCVAATRVCRCLSPGAVHRHRQTSILKLGVVLSHHFQDAF